MDFIEMMHCMHLEAIEELIEIKKSKGETKVTGDEIYKYDLLNCEVKMIEEALNE